MGTRTLVIVLAFAGATLARADLDFSPKEASYELDGVKFRQLAFANDAGKDATYAPPHGWSYSGSATSLRLSPAGKIHAEATISRVVPAKPVVFDEDGVKQLIDQATLSLPKGSLKVTLVSQAANPVVIERKDTVLLVLSYTYLGENFERSIMFLNRPHDQIRFELTARQTDFKDLQKAFLDSQFSWQNL